MNGKHAQRSHEAQDAAHKYITFKLGAEEYGIELLELRELISVPEITRVSRAKGHILGLINLRGRIIPVLDLRAKFGMSPSDVTSQSVLLIVQVVHGVHTATTGILVDEVLEVRAIRNSDIEPASGLQDQVDASFVLGVGKLEAGSVCLLDIDRVLSSEPDTQSLALN
jgi:purine-binding chemotaxis protein CheW